MTSLEMIADVASGQFISNWARFRAVSAAMGCLLSRNWVWLTQPALKIVTAATGSMNGFFMIHLLS
jgi:hypothetical protein